MEDNNIVAISASCFKKLLQIMNREEFDVDVDSAQYGGVKKRFKIRTDAPPLRESIKDYKYKLILWDSFSGTWSILNLKDVISVYIGGLELSADDLRTFAVGTDKNSHDIKGANGKNFEDFREEILKIKNIITNDYGKGI